MRLTSDFDTKGRPDGKYRSADDQCRFCGTEYELLAHGWFYYGNEWEFVYASSHRLCERRRHHYYANRYDQYYELGFESPRISNKWQFRLRW